MQYYLMRYGYMSEDYMMRDAVILNPINGSGTTSGITSTDAAVRKRLFICHHTNMLGQFTSNF